MPDLFEDLDLAMPGPRVLMSLHAEYYELIVSGEKRFEYRKRYAVTGPSRWYVYLNAPVSRLAAVIELGTPIHGSPTDIAELAEKARHGNGQSVHDYLAPAGHGVALPIHHLYEYPGITAAELTASLGKWHPPQGYTLIDRHPDLAAVCDQLTTESIVRQRHVEHDPAVVP